MRLCCCTQAESGNLPPVLQSTALSAHSSQPAGSKQSRAQARASSAATGRLTLGRQAARLRAVAAGMDPTAAGALLPASLLTSGSLLCLWQYVWQRAALRTRPTPLLAGPAAAGPTGRQRALLSCSHTLYVSSCPHCCGGTYVHRNGCKHGFHCPLCAALRARVSLLLGHGHSTLHAFFQQSPPHLASFAIACCRLWQKTTSALSDTFPAPTAYSPPPANPYNPTFSGQHPPSSPIIPVR